MTAGEVRRQTGATRRQLERWERAGYLVPAVVTGTGHGSRRAYSAANVADIAAAVALIREGYRVGAAWERVNGRTEER